MTKHTSNRLTQAQCKKAGPGKHSDGNGLMLWVKPSGSKSWVQRIVIQGQRRNLGLGGYPLTSLPEAREKAFHNRKIARQGGNPVTDSPKVPTFKQAAAKVIALHMPTWRNGSKSAAQWEASLKDYAFPKIGNMPVDAIEAGNVMQVLKPIWVSKHETARRVRQRIGAVMKWAIAEGYRSDNPAGEAISAALPRNGNGTKRHMKALHYSQVSTALQTIRESQGAETTKLALEFIILTAARSGEVRLMTWEEIDFDKAVWTVPAERMKAGKEHRVPLSARAVRILERAKGLHPSLVFPSVTGKAMSDNTLSKLCRENQVGCVPHGFRSSFRDWASEVAKAPREVSEACLAHTVKGVEGAYFRSDLLEARRSLLEQWAKYI